MAFTNPKKLLQNAQKNKVGVIAFNAINLETMEAIIKTASKLKTPVIVQTSLSTVTNYASPEFFVACAKILEKKYKIDFALHLDHATSFEACKKAIDAGYTSVMIDGSSLDFKKNVALSKKVCEYAHKNNVWCEAEFGRLIGEEDDVKVKSEDELFTNPAKAKEFIDATKCDALAISVGTSHGAFKVFRKEGLRHDIIKEISKLSPKTILVLHGASMVEKSIVESINKVGGKISKTNGTSLTEIIKAIDAGATKINMDSDLRLAYTFGVRSLLKTNPQVFDIRSITKSGIQQIENAIEERLKQICKK